MQLNTKTIEKHFLKSLDKYVENAIIQKIMADKIYHYVEGKSYKQILEIGSGAGLLTRRLAHIGFELYTANDLVPQSELYVKKYIPSAEFLCGDFRFIENQRNFDLIVSNAVFQWCDNLDTVISKCASLLNDNGVIVFSTFLPDNFKEFRQITGLTLNYKSVDEIINILNKKFKVLSLEAFKKKLQFTAPLDMLIHMKNTGVNSLSETKWGICKVKDFCKRYSEEYPSIELTYNPVIIMAKKYRTY